MASPNISDLDGEKGGVVAETHDLDGGLYEEGLGDLQVLKTSDSGNLKLAKDGVTVLIPQPSDE